MQKAYCILGSLSEFASTQPFMETTRTDPTQIVPSAGEPGVFVFLSFEETRIGKGKKIK